MKNTMKEMKETGATFQSFKQMRPCSQAHRRTKQNIYKIRCSKHLNIPNFFLLLKGLYAGLNTFMTPKVVN